MFHFRNFPILRRFSSLGSCLPASQLTKVLLSILMIAALRRGEIDLALTAYGAEAPSHDFYTHKLATVPSVVVLPFDHPPASQKQISISQLKNESFVGVPDDVAQGPSKMFMKTIWFMPLLATWPTLRVILTLGQYSDFPCLPAHLN